VAGAFVIVRWIEIYGSKQSHDFLLLEILNVFNEGGCDCILFRAMLAEFLRVAN
jgi:hypothetical protein